MKCGQRARYASRMSSYRSARCTTSPVIRNIYVVTAGQRPVWLEVSGDVTVVDHRRSFRAGSSADIQQSRDRGEHPSDRWPCGAFLYLNDDMFFGRAVLRTVSSSTGRRAELPVTGASILENGSRLPVDLAVKNSRG